MSTPVPQVPQLCVAFWLTYSENLWSTCSIFNGLEAARDLRVFLFPLPSFSRPSLALPTPYHFPPQGEPSGSSLRLLIPKVSSKDSSAMVSA